MLFDKDQGDKFGTWGDDTSRYMYHEAMEQFIGQVDWTPKQTIGDYGGANGLLKKFVSNPVTTIDVDESKKPDIVDDMVTHGARYDIGFTRYTLHYLTDQQVLAFVDNVNVGKLYLMQFVQPGSGGLRDKYANSVGEGTRYFRTEGQLKSLLPRNRTTLVWVSRLYFVSRAFYKNRLGLEDAKPHDEYIVVYRVTK